MFLRGGGELAVGTPMRTMTFKSLSLNIFLRRYPSLQATSCIISGYIVDALWTRWWQTGRKKDGAPEEYNVICTVDGLYIYWQVYDFPWNCNLIIFYENTIWKGIQINLRKNLVKTPYSRLHFLLFTFSDRRINISRIKKECYFLTFFLHRSPIDLRSLCKELYVSALLRKKIGFQETKPNAYPQYSYPREFWDFVRALAPRDIKGDITGVITSTYVLNYHYFKILQEKSLPR